MCPSWVNHTVDDRAISPLGIARPCHHCLLAMLCVVCPCGTIHTGNVLPMARLVRVRLNNVGSCCVKTMIEGFGCLTLLQSLGVGMGCVGGWVGGWIGWGGWVGGSRGLWLWLLRSAWARDIARVSGTRCRPNGVCFGLNSLNNQVFLNSFSAGVFRN